MSLIINGSLTKPFKIECGLRQGDPLSLFIFLLVVDVMHRILNKAEADGVIEGISVGKHRVHLSHIQFVDDTILFALAKKEVLVNFRYILDCFELMSGLSINYDKLAIFPVTCNEELVREINSKIRCSVASLPTKYWGPYWSKSKQDGGLGADS